MRDNTFYYVVSSGLILALWILGYLVGVNVISRRAAHKHLRTIGPCLHYLLLLHVSSFITIVTLLLKHTEVLTSYNACHYVNTIIFISMMSSRFFIGLVWESRHRAVTDTLCRKNSVFGRASLALTKLLVLAPLALLAFTSSSRTLWERSTNICIRDTAKTVSYIEAVIILGTTLMFFFLFLAHVWKTCRLVTIFRADTRDLSQDSDTQYVRTSISVQERLAHAAFRNVIVVFSCLFWLIVYDFPLNKDIAEITSTTITYIYWSRTIIVLDQLSTNSFLYFLFRNWSFFIFNPCWGEMSSYLVDEDMTASNARQQLLESENETVDIIST